MVMPTFYRVSGGCCFIINPFRAGTTGQQNGIGREMSRLSASEIRPGRAIIARFQLFCWFCMNLLPEGHWLFV